MSAERLTELIESASHIRDIQAEVRRLREVEAWALAQLPFSDGDRVVVARDLDITPKSGWWPYRQILAPGSTGAVRGIYLHRGTWYVMFRPDVQWSVSNYPEPNGRIYARSKPADFALPLTSLRRRKKKDHPLTIPVEAVATT